MIAHSSPRLLCSHPNTVTQGHVTQVYGPVGRTEMKRSDSSRLATTAAGQGLLIGDASIMLTEMSATNKMLCIEKSIVW